MKVKLLSFNPHALELLLYTKNTRLQGTQTLTEIIKWPMEKKLEHLAYMRDTIKSSWEFSHYVFEIQGVTRAFTHQLVRTRNASYAQESQRTVDVSDHQWLNTVDHEINDGFERGRFDVACNSALFHYKEMIDYGVPVQDARGILPTNILTNIIMGVNLRTLHEMALVRLCTRTQGEYQDVFKEMRKRVIEVHPWAEDFIQVYCATHGTCCFPRYKECPVKKYVPEIDNVVKQVIKEKWTDFDHEAVPVAKDGKTM
jgi:flavin-dependent thymidylate synthase